MLVIVPLSARAAPYAEMVMDARTGEVLRSRNAETRLHPASLTKMMTLYVVFEAVERGEISLDTKVRISKKAAGEEPSKLGMVAGQRIKLRYLIRAAAVKSANDAATALAEAIEGSEAAFARRMNRTAKALGMTRTTFKNAHGLTESGHLSTARDMTILGRHLLYDHSDYYNLFSRRSTDAGIKTVNNTNRKLLAAYKGADGIKTGYTRAAGFNLVASAERGNQRVIATVFGGRSTATRNAKVAELLDLGFRRAPRNSALRLPSPPNYNGQAVSSKTVIVNTLSKKSLRPRPRPSLKSPVLLALQDDINTALAEASASVDAVSPQPRVKAEEVRLTSRAGASQAAAAQNADLDEPEVVTRLSTTGARHWGINIGRYPSRYAAERVLLKVALNEMSTLDGTIRTVSKRKSGFDANFMGMTRDSAELACRRLQARQMNCFMIGPG
ncbi:MAG: D-alanyl-D-alanine carboxypeptidase [Thalassovita sp.]